MRTRGLAKTGVMLCVLWGLCGAAWPAQEAAPPEPAPEMTPEESADAEIGKSAAEEVESRFKIVEESPALPRICTAVERIRPVTEKPHQEYQFKVIDSKAVNAFSLPGGYLYYMQGLLDAVESDDELAAVTAHEMAHVCLDHSRELMAKDERYTKILTPLVLMSVLSNSESVDPGAIATIGTLVVQDALNHYGREAEFQADSHAVLYLKQTGEYNPVAVLTVVEGLARIESGEAAAEMGVFQTHPYAKERVKAVIARLQELGIPIERRRVTQSLVAEAGSVRKGEQEMGELLLNGRVVVQPAAEVDGLSGVARAERSAEVLNSLLLASLQLIEIVLQQDGDSIRMAARGETILTVSPEDAAVHESTVGELAEKAMAVVRVAFREEKVQRAY
jgi:hypothetical protein